MCTEAQNCGSSTRQKSSYLRGKADADDYEEVRLVGVDNCIPDSIHTAL